jgi:hydrogenase expression/formation protein HypE
LRLLGDSGLVSRSDAEIDPYFLACEGRVVAAAAPEAEIDILRTWRGLPGTEQAAVIGRIQSGSRRVIVETEIGGERLLDELKDNPLPRIC